MREWEVEFPKEGEEDPEGLAFLHNVMYDVGGGRIHIVDREPYATFLSLIIITLIKTTIFIHMKTKKIEDVLFFFSALRRASVRGGFFHVH